ncbi:GNAT family N-acetyltransferase [Paenibacillus sp. MBLB4367]|uniref:GNAT family N-acetyltransferase n=1 Tax=Paenibacillus sp. MBLB4367 TaxID=3384767 RepID=UPI003908213E
MKPLIETPRLLIKPYMMEEMERLLPILTDAQTMSFWPAPFTKEQTEGWLLRSIASYEKHGYGRWGIELKESGELIGDVGIQVSEIDGTLERDLGYIIHWPFWHKGYAVEAADACLHYGLKELGLSRICANMPYDHYVSKRVAEKIGMTFEKQFHNQKNRGILTYLFSIQAK